MAKIERTSLVEKARAQLLAELAAGRFGELMPSMRRLAQDLGVSVPTLGLAMQALAEEGWITAQGDRRRWKVARRPSRLPARSAGARVPRGAGMRRKKLLFLVPRSMDAPTANWMAIFQALLRSLDPNEWEVVQWSEKYLHTTRARKSWDTMWELLQPDCMIAYLGMPVLEDWARKRGIPTLFVGGVSGGGLPVIGVSFSQMLKEAITRMLELGHRRIVIPMFAKNPGFLEGVRRSVADIASGHQDGSEIEVVDSSYSSPEVVVQLLERIWPRRKPDAVIFADWTEFIAASSYFRRNGIEIGVDVSVVVTADDPMDRWFLPKITHFMIPPRRLARGVRTWLGSQAGTNPTGYRTIQATWVEGDSVRDLRK